MARNAAFYIDRALTAFNAGFSSKSGQKDAVGDLNRACDIYYNELHSEMLQVEYEDRSDEWHQLYHNVPFYIHLWNEKRRKQFAAYSDYVAKMDDLFALLAPIKEAVIVPPVKDETKAKVEAIRMSLVDLIAKRNGQFVEGVSLVEHFGQLPVSVSAHYVTNAHGTHFIRHFFYMNGTLTPLNVIIAVLDATRKED